MNNPSRITYACCSGLMAIGVSITLLVGCENPVKQTAQAPIEVTAVTVAARALPRNIQFVGQTVSDNLVEVRSKVQGYLKKRLYQEGQLVHSGDILFEIDPKPLQISVDASRAQLAREEAALRGAQKELARIRPLAEARAASKRDLDIAEVQLATAEAAVNLSRAQLAAAALNLEYATIKSPITGIISRTLIHEGTLITAAAGQEGLLATITPIDPLRVNFSVTDYQHMRFQEQLKQGKILFPADGVCHFELLLADGGIYPNQGELVFKDPVVNPSTGSFTVTGRIPNPEGLLVPGQFVRVKVLGISLNAAITIAQRAVLQGVGSKFVYTVENNRARRIPVEVGEWVGEDYVVTSGLKGGETVVVDGVEKLSNGQEIVLRAGPAAAASPKNVQENH